MQKLWESYMQEIGWKGIAGIGAGTIAGLGAIGIGGKLAIDRHIKLKSDFYRVCKNKCQGLMIKKIQQKYSAQDINYDSIGQYCTSACTKVYNDRLKKMKELENARAQQIKAIRNK